MSKEKQTPFFRKIDWASFWTATAISFAVYFLTLGPSVGLEDSGELAVAGDHLGVPHPPGYPIWSIISFFLARIFSFVTFRGQPDPAWAIALGSAIFGALAAGCTAMLITRSASDMLADAGTVIKRDNKSGDNLVCWAGGVAGSLLFAFSPVMWSQSTIVEVYSLGAFFLMLVLLLTYRWMRRPSDKLLWVTAFVFGLGLTNYQVLLLAALPLVVIIFLRDIALFRDFMLVAIPFGLAAVILKLGSLPMQQDLPKQMPVLLEVNIPSPSLCLAGVVAFALALAVMLAWRRTSTGNDGRDRLRQPMAYLCGGLVGLAVFLLFLGASVTKPGIVGSVNAANIALMEPAKYAVYAALLTGVLGLSSFAAAFGGGDWKSKFTVVPAGFAGLFFLIALFMAFGVEGAQLPRGIDLSTVPTLGIGMYNAAFALGIVVFLALAFATPRGLLFAAPLAAVEIVLYVLVLKGVFLGLTHPSTWWFWAPVVFNFVLLIHASLTLPSGFSVAMTFLMGELGVSFYVYMPIVSDLRNPPMNWGYPRTWEGFKHALTRGQYEKIAPTNIFAPRFIHQIGDYFTDLRRQFTLLLAPFGFLPFAAWRLCRGGDAKGDRRLLGVAAGFALLALVLWGVDCFVAADAISDKTASMLRLVSVLLMLVSAVAAIWGGMRPLDMSVALIAVTIFFVILGNIPAIESVFDASRIDKLSFGVLLLVCFLGGAWMVYSQMEDAVRRMLRERNLSETVTVGMVVAGAGLFAVGLLYKILQACIVYLFAKAENIPVDKIASKWSDVFKPIMSDHFAACTFAPGVFAVVIVAAAVFGLWTLSRRKLVSSSLDAVSQQWIIGSVCNFLVMSIFLIMLANPKGDLQDTFIQKVKFISSHGLFALWIGYGLIFALVVLNGMVAGLCRLNGKINGVRGERIEFFAKFFAVVAAALVFASSFIPVYENYYNDRLVFELSGAEQNGHDYGWQFGNYQLRGADAIIEELEDEEPLPNPLFPPAMGEKAVFFGGTDPGRFVPTYMIYSADVRPDVFLITQNALADNTFMSVTRDLYADQLWIPTPKDSENAFAVYVDEVRSGKRPQNADLVIENNRVQVVGALGVMEINGILCDMIFKHNKRWHNFYVEESYVIPWMYPYLTPHGLIMQINAEMTPLTQKHVTDDMDFWDWYVRRITRDDRFRRDLPAQKSFSKLRSAIAGLYMNRGRYADAERAYNEARLLYPVSPEATFRAVQDVLLRQGRLEEALEVVKFFIQQDPNNDRGPYVRDYILETQKAQAELEACLASEQVGGKYPLDMAFRIAELEAKLGNEGGVRALLAKYVDEPGLSVGDGYRLALLLDKVRDVSNAARAMNRVWKSSWVLGNSERAMTAIRIYGSLGDMEKLRSLMPAYLKLKPTDWQAWLDWSLVQVTEGKIEAAMASLENGMRYGGEKAYAVIEKNQTLMALAQRVIRKLQQAQGAAGMMPGGVGMPLAPGAAGK